MKSKEKKIQKPCLGVKKRTFSAIGIAFLLIFFAFACKTAKDSSSRPQKKVQNTNKMKVQQGWQGNNEYWAYGESNADANPASNKETKQSSCKRRAVFEAKSSIIPAFMSSPNAKPSYNLKQKMTILLKIIENGEVVEFKYHPSTDRCRVLLKIEKPGLRSMVEDVN